MEISRYVVLKAVSRWKRRQAPRTESLTAMYALVYLELKTVSPEPESAFERVAVVDQSRVVR